MDSLDSHWADAHTLGDRAHFDLELEALVIEPVLTRDANLYRCRVDFKSSPTRNSRVKLSVIGE